MPPQSPTFTTKASKTGWPRSRPVCGRADDVASWFDGVHPIIVGEEAGKVFAFASTSNYRPRDCYKGIAEASVYVARNARCRGAGRAVLQALITACEQAGYWKLVSRVFPENVASRRLIDSFGFREVGVYQKHGQLDGVWRDVIIVERSYPAGPSLGMIQSHCTLSVIPSRFRRAGFPFEFACTEIGQCGVELDTPAEDCRTPALT